MAELKNKDEQYSIFLRYKKSKNKKNNIDDNNKKDNNKKGSVLIFFKLVLLSAFMVLLTLLTMHVINNYDSILLKIDEFTGGKFALGHDDKLDLSHSKFSFRMLSRYQNILLLGVDSNGPDTLPFSGVRSDTMIVLSVDLYGKNVNAVSIPRDSKVYLADAQGINKINAAYALGGIELTKKTIEETFGIKIHNYIVVNAEGVRKIVDVIGGVPVHIDQSMHYHDRTAKLNVDFDKGDYVLNGKQAEEYLRFRKDMHGDIGRVHRQQKFIKALLEQLKSPETLKKIPETLKIAGLYTRSDLNLYQLSQYASIARELDLNKVEFMLLPGAPNKKGNISYWILDPDKTQQVINRLIYRKRDVSAENDITVGLLYSKPKEIEANIIHEELKEAGYDVNCTVHSDKITDTQIIGYNSQISSDTIRTIQEKVPQIADFEYIHSPVRNFCDSSDIVITLNNSENLI